MKHVDSRPGGPALFLATTLLVAAAALGVEAVGAVLLIAAAASALTGRPARGPALALFAISGWMLAASFRAVEAPGFFRRLVEVEVEVIGPTRSFSGSQRTPVRRRADGQRLLLVESEAAAPRRRGQVYSIRGWLEPPWPARNPGGRPQTSGRLQVSSPQHVERRADRVGPIAGPLRLLDHLAESCDRRLAPGPGASSGPLLRALLLGRPEALGFAIRQRLRSTGCYHLFAVSGLHVGLVAGLALLLVRRFPGSAGLRDGIAFTAVVAYAGVTGGRPPVLRATLLFAGWLWCRHRGRAASVSAVLAGAFALLVAAEPERLRQPGMQFSFAAVLGIAAAARYRRADSPRGTGTGIRPWRPLGRALWISSAATLATAPLAAWHYGSFSPWAPLATLAVGPLLLPLMLGGAGWLALDALHPLAARPLGAALEGISCSVEALVEQLDRLPATPHAAELFHPAVPGLLLFALLLLYARRPAPALACVVAAACATLLARPRNVPGLAMFDVGQGQAVLLTDSDRQVLVDAGCRGRRALPAGALLRALTCLGATRLDALVLSHLDADHTSRAVVILEEFDVGELILSSAHRGEWWSAPAGSGVGQLRWAARRAGVAIRWVSRGDRIGSLEVVWPPRGRRFLSDNEGSVALLQRLGREIVLLPGDLEGPVLSEMGRSLPLAPTILVLPHHGHPDPCQRDRLSAWRPRIALASRSEPLPGAETRLWLEELGIPHLSTARGGAIRIEWSGDCANLHEVKRGARR